MRLSNETRAEDVNVYRNIDDLVQVLKAQNADSHVVAQCLQHLATMLRTLGEPAVATLVREHVETAQRSQADHLPVLEFQE